MILFKTLHAPALETSRGRLVNVASCIVTFPRVLHLQDCNVSTLITIASDMWGYHTEVVNYSRIQLFGSEELKFVIKRLTIPLLPHWFHKVDATSILPFPVRDITCRVHIHWPYSIICESEAIFMTATCIYKNMYLNLWSKVHIKYNGHCRDWTLPTKYMTAISKVARWITKNNCILTYGLGFCQ